MKFIKLHYDSEGNPEVLVNLDRVTEIVKRPAGGVVIEFGSNGYLFEESLEEIEERIYGIGG